MKKNDALRHLPASSIRSVLESILEVRRRIDNGEELDYPLLTFQLYNGGTVPGWLLSISNDNEGQFVLIQLGGQGHAFEESDPDVMYIGLQAIQSVIVPRIGNIMHILSSGKIPPPVREGPLNQLDLKKKAQTLGEKISDHLGVGIAFEADWEKLPKSDERLWNILDIMIATSSVLRDITNADFEKAEVSKVLRRVRFEDAPKGVELQKDTLTIKARFGEGAEGRLSFDELRSGISAVF